MFEENREALCCTLAHEATKLISELLHVLWLRLRHLNNINACLLHEAEVVVQQALLSCGIWGQSIEVVERDGGWRLVVGRDCGWWLVAGGW